MLKKLFTLTTIDAFNWLVSLDVNIELLSQRSRVQFPNLKEKFSGIIAGLLLTFESSFMLMRRVRQWCSIFHFHWWTASIKSRLLLSSYRLCFLKTHFFSDFVFYLFSVRVCFLLWHFYYFGSKPLFVMKCCHFLCNAMLFHLEFLTHWSVWTIIRVSKYRHSNFNVCLKMHFIWICMQMVIYVLF